MDDQTTELLRGSIRGVLAEIAGGTGRTGRPGRSLRARLDDLGWAEVLADDPATATTVLFAEHGRQLARTRALDDVVLAALDDVLPPMQGERAVAHPHPMAIDLFAFAPAATPLPGAGPGRVVVLGPLDGVDEVVVPVRADESVGAVVVPVGALRTVPVDTFDHDAGWTAIELTDVGADVIDLGERWSAAVAGARRALAAELLGVCEAMLALAVEHTSARVQYGRRIASFQAVRHRLAEAHADIVGCQSLLTAAWADGGPWAAAIAKQAAGHLHQKVSGSALQVCGALGLSQEYALHRFVTRAALCDALYLPHQQLDAQLGRELLDPANLGRPLARVTEL